MLSYITQGITRRCKEYTHVHSMHMLSRKTCTLHELGRPYINSMCTSYAYVDCIFVIAVITA